MEFKVTLHKQVRYRGHLTVLKITVCHTAGHYGEENDDWNMQCRLEVAAELQWALGDLGFFTGGWLGWPVARQPISYYYYYACDNLFRCRSLPFLEPNRQTLKFHSPVSPDPLNVRSFGFPKSPPLKNPRSANAHCSSATTSRRHCMFQSSFSSP